jgi:hypothetical protein
MTKNEIIVALRRSEMRNIQWFLAIAAIAMVVGRMTVPGHDLTGWPGAYEAFAHIALGAMIAIAFLVPEVRRPAIYLIVAVTLFETICFLMRPTAAHAETATPLKNPCDYMLPTLDLAYNDLNAEKTAWNTVARISDIATRECQIEGPTR